MAGEGVSQAPRFGGGGGGDLVIGDFFLEILDGVVAIVGVEAEGAFGDGG